MSRIPTSGGVGRDSSTSTFRASASFSGSHNLITLVEPTYATDLAEEAGTPGQQTCMQRMKLNSMSAALQAVQPSAYRPRRISSSSSSSSQIGTGISRIPSTAQPPRPGRGADGLARAGLSRVSISSTQPSLPTTPKAGQQRSPASVTGSVDAPSILHIFHANAQQQSPSDFTPAAAPVASSSTVVVAVRLRPLSEKEKLRGDHETWGLDGQGNVGVMERATGNFTAKHRYDYTFNQSANNEDVFRGVAQPLLAPLLMGISCTVFAYGVTSSGKTHTLFGGNPETGGDPGLVPRCVSALFEMIQAAQAQHFTVRLSMMEIYNEVLNDLLDPQHTNLRLFEDRGKGVVVEGLREEAMGGAAQALAAIARGDANRKVSATAFNEDSSRSHTLVRLVVEGRDVAPGSGGTSTPGEVAKSVPGRTTTATLSLIDLAGSESAKATHSKGQRMEGSFINKSLLTLGTVINRLAEGLPGSRSISAAHGHIPFRDSKLTRLLQNSLMGVGARIAVVCNITPAGAQSEETANTLKFATRAKLVRVSVSAASSLDERALLRQYRHELRELRLQVATLLAANETERAGSAEPGGQPSAAVAQLMVQLTWEQRARVKAEEECASLEARIQGMTLLLRGGGASNGVMPARPRRTRAASSAGVLLPTPTTLESPHPNGSQSGGYPPVQFVGDSLPQGSASHPGLGRGADQPHMGPFLPPPSDRSSPSGLHGDRGLRRDTTHSYLGSSSLGEDEFDTNAELALLEAMESLQVEFALPSPGGGLQSEPSCTSGLLTMRSMTPSIMEEGDSAIEIQVLLADREVLQDQVIAVELSNERLMAQNEVLEGTLDRLQMELKRMRALNAVQASSPAPPSMPGSTFNGGAAGMAGLASGHSAEMLLHRSAKLGLDPTVWLSPGNLGAAMFEAAGLAEPGPEAGTAVETEVKMRVKLLEGVVIKNMANLVERNAVLERQLLLMQGVGLEELDPVSKQEISSKIMVAHRAMLQGNSLFSGWPPPAGS